MNMMGEFLPGFTRKMDELRDGRRSYGQRMLDRDVPIEYVSYCMGHQSVETTQKYYADYRDKKVLSKVCGILGQGGNQAF